MLITGQITPKNIDNPISGLPSINILELNDVMRVDQSLGDVRLKFHIETAFDTINGQLEPWLDSIIAEIAITPATRKGQRFTRAYKRAVLHETCALVSDQNADLDTASSSRMREEKQIHIVDKPQRMRRIVQHAIADLTGRTRNRVKLT